MSYQKYLLIAQRSGEHYALGVYLGHKGLYYFTQMEEHAETIPLHQLLHYQDCLMCSFEDRELLTAEDRKQIKDIGLSFRGRNAWPMFRRYEPGYHPWYINQEECVFLTQSLRQTLFVIEKVRSGSFGVDTEHGKNIVRYGKEKDGNLEWFSKGVKLGYPTVSYKPVEINDDMLIRKIKKAGTRDDIVIQTDICYMPSPVQEEKHERPYYPRIFILADKKSGMIMDYEMYRDINEDADVALHKLINSCLIDGAPSEIQVGSEMMVAIFEDLCKKTGIKLKKVKRLPEIEQFIEGLYTFTRG